MKQLIFLLTFLFSSNLLADGGMTGGGGDILRLRFLDGQKLAISILEAIDENSFSETTPAEIQNWILSNQGRWAADIRSSRHDWQESTTQITCAWTEFRNAAPIKLSFEACRQSIYDDISAAAVLFHESAHHLDVQDELFADLLAQAAVTAWRNRTLASMPLCKDPNNIVASRIFGSWIPDTELSLRLLGEVPPFFSSGRMSYISDDSVARFFPGFGKCAFAAGWLHTQLPPFEGKPPFDGTIPFILAEHQGNPAIFFDEEDFRAIEEGRDPQLEVITDLHRGFRMIARGIDPSRDILFVGGDNNNQPLYPFKRAEN